MADTDWVQDPSNPNRMTFTGDDGIVHEAIKQPDPTTVPEDGVYNNFATTVRAESLRGLPGSIASAISTYAPFGAAHSLYAQKYPNLTYGQINDLSGKLTNDARSKEQADLDLEENAHPLYGQGWEHALNPVNILPKLIGNVASNAQYMLGAGGESAIAGIAGGAVGAGGVDAIDQASKVGLGQQDQIDPMELAQQTAIGGGFTAGLHGLFHVGGKVADYLKGALSEKLDPHMAEPVPDGTSPTQYSTEDEQHASQLFKTGTADDIRAYSDYLKAKYGRGLDTSGTDAFVAYRDKGNRVDTTLRYPEGKEMETQSSKVDPAATQAAAQELLTKHPTDVDLGAVDHAVSHPEDVEQSINRIAAEQVANADVDEGTKAAAQAVLDRGARRDDAINHINKVTSPWQNSPEFIVHSDFRDMGAGSDVPPDALGYYDPQSGQVHVNVARLGHEVDAEGNQIPGSVNKANLTGLIYHEALGHYGLDQTFGDGLTAMANKLDSSNPKFQKAVDDWLEANPDTYADRENTRALAAEEVFAQQSERGIRNPSTWNIAKAAIKNTGRRLGLDLKYSDGEINTILGIAHQGVVSGTSPRLNFYRNSPIPKSGTGDFGIRTSDTPQSNNDNNDWGDKDEPVTSNPSGLKRFEDMNSRDLRALASKDEGPRFSLKNKGEANNWRDARDKLANIGNGETGIVRRPVNPDGSLSEDDYYQFHHRTLDGKDVTGTYRLENNKIVDMGIERPRETSGIFRANTVGPSTIRQIGRDIMANHPGVDAISGYRISGARPAPATVESGKRFSYNPDNIKTTKDISDLLKTNTVDKTIKSWEDTESEALARGINTSSVLRGKSLADAQAVIEQARQVNTQNYEKLSSLWDKYEKSGFSADLYDQVIKHSVLTSAVDAKLQNDVTGVARALNILKKTSMSREFAKGLSQTLNDTGIPAFDDPEQFHKFMQNLGEHIKNNDPNAAMNLVSKTGDPRFSNIAQRVWFNGMLSGLSTHVKIPLSSTLHMLVDLSARTASIGEGAVRSLITGSNAIDKTTPAEVGYRIHGIIQGLMNMDNWSAARKALNTGQTGDRVFGNTAAGAYQGNNPIKGFLSGFLESGTRLSAGEEELIRNIFKNAEMHGNAARQAVQEGFAGKALDIRVKQILNDPSPALLKIAADNTKVLQFHDASGPMGSTIKYAIQRVPVLKVLAPMVSIADRVMSSMIRYGPAPLSALDRYNLPGLSLKNGSQEAQVARARMVLGSALFGYAMMSAANGLITGEGPGNPERRADWLVNHQPNSIRIGDKWHSYAGLGEPLAGPLSMAASTFERANAREINFHQDPLTATEHLLTGWGSSLIGSGPLHNFAQLVEAQTPDETRSDHVINSLTAGVASSFVPAVARRYAQDADPRITDTRGNGFSEIVGNRLKSQLPGQTQDLPQRNDVLGNPEYHEPNIGSTLTGSRTKTISDDPVSKEIDRLDSISTKPVIGYAGKSQVTDPVSGQKRPMTQWEYQAYQGLSGQYIHNYIAGMIKSGEWKKLSDEDKLYDLHGGKPGESDEGAIREARKAAHEKLFNQPDQ